MDFIGVTLNESVDVIGEINSQQNPEQQNEETVEKIQRKGVGDLHLLYGIIFRNYLMIELFARHVERI